MKLNQLHQSTLLLLLLSVSGAGFCSAPISFPLSPIAPVSLGQKILHAPPGQGGGKAQLLPETVVRLQSSTPGTQQTGHFNISGTGIVGSLQTSGFQMSTGAGPGRVLTSDASGNATWQALPPPSGAAGGDLSGTYPNPMVAGLQTRPVSSTAPSSGQVLKWNGSAWAPAVDELGSLTLPFSGSANVGSGAVFSITNNATNGYADGVWGRTNSTDATGVLGWAMATSGNCFGGFFRTDSTSGKGVLGYATAGTGVTYGVLGASDSTSGTGVYGVSNASTGSTTGVYGEAVSPGGIAVSGYERASTGTTYGGYFRSDSSSGIGVYGLATATSGTTYGVYGQSDSLYGTGVYGFANATYGVSDGVFGRSNSIGGRGVVGYAAATAGSDTYGVYGITDSDSGTGVSGWATRTTGGTYGVSGSSASSGGAGVYGLALSSTGYTAGVVGRSNSPSGTGMVGNASATSGNAWGVYALSNSSASNAYGVIGWEPLGGAGHAVYADGSFAATGTKSFQIDHPLSPETHYLNHFCTEGPQPMNAYSGNVVTDGKGYATIQLPDYFESINRDPTYHLTVIDDSDDFVLAKVVREIQNNQFVIRTNKPHVKVSWRVEAIRNDRYVQQYGYQTVQEKEDEIKGKYVQPELYGQPKEMGIHYRPMSDEKIMQQPRQK